MPKSRVYALCGGMFALIGIAAMARHDILPGMLMFLLAVGCGVRANGEWRREQG